MVQDTSSNRLVKYSIEAKNVGTYQNISKSDNATSVDCTHLQGNRYRTLSIQHFFVYFNLKKNRLLGLTCADNDVTN
jgi:hypothetical protein